MAVVGRHDNEAFVQIDHRVCFGDGIRQSNRVDERTVGITEMMRMIDAPGFDQ